MNKLTSLPRKQRGIVTIMAAILLFAGVIYWLQQTYGIIGNTSQSNATQLDSIQAFFLAESGVEQGKSILSSAGPTSSSVCTSLSASTDISLGRGTFTLSGVPGPTGCINDCTSCKITSTGAVGLSSRAIEVVISVSTPNGGAAGCGGGGTPAPTCPVDSIPAADIYQNIKQTIEVKTAPVILFSAMAFTRHPAGSTNNVDANACVAEPGGNACITQWDVESNDSAGSTVVGSRGSAIRLNPTTTPVTYELTQTLTNDSLFAAISAKFGGGSSLEIIGTATDSSAYWDDNSNSGDATVANNATSSGKTNNGAACEIPNGSTACPNGTQRPVPPTYNTKQASKNWCYDGDTLVFGFSGKSATGSNGALNSFTFGTSPQSSVVPTPGVTPPGVVPFPRPVAGVINSELYASLRWIHNPYYRSAAGAASSGGLVSAKAGIPNASLSASVTSGSPALTVTAIGAGYAINSGDEVRCTSTGAGCTENALVGVVTGNTACGGTFPCSTPGAYTLGANSPLSNNTRLEVRSNILHVTSFTNGWLSKDDVLTINGTTTATKITSMATGCPNTTTCQNVSGNYGITPASAIASGTGNVEANGYTIHASGATAPPAGAIVEASGYPAAGKIKTQSPQAHERLACVAKTSADDPSTATNPNPAPERSASLFYLNDYVDTGDPLTSQCGTTRLTNGPGNAYGTANRLVANQICGGICAFFNHDATINQGMTNFAIGIANTNQWAGGMTCLKGVDPSTIEGLVGTQPSVKATNWHEIVR